MRSSVNSLPPVSSQADWQLAARHRARVAEAAVCLLVARLAVGLAPFRTWQATVGAPPTVAGSAISAEDALRARRVGRSATRAAERMPFACKCLPRAVAVQWMLRRRAIPAELVIGYHAAAEEPLHAWVEVGGAIVIGAHDAPYREIIRLRA